MENEFSTVGKILRPDNNVLIDEKQLQQRPEINLTIRKDENVAGKLASACFALVQFLSQQHAEVQIAYQLQLLLSSSVDWTLVLKLSPIAWFDHILRSDSSSETLQKALKIARKFVQDEREAISAQIVSVDPPSKPSPPNVMYCSYPSTCTAKVEKGKCSKV